MHQAAAPLDTPIRPWRDLRHLHGAICAIGGVGAAYWLTRLLEPWLGGGVSPLFFVAVMFSAFVGGLGWSLVATVLATFCAAALKVPADGVMGLGWDDAIRIIVFLGVAVLVSSLQHAREVTLRNLERAVDEAEHARRDVIEASRAKDRFLNILGHELRNPLNPIVAAVTLRLQDLTGLDDPASVSLREDFELIRRNAEAEARLVDDLLDFNRIRTGKLRLVRTGVDIATLAAEAIEAVRPAAEVKGLSLKLRLHALPTNATGAVPLVPVVDGDSVRLRQVLWNLLNNAVKFTETGGVNMTVRPSVGGRGVVIAVGDSGLGISPNQQHVIFEPFTQVFGPEERVPASNTVGLGLGLSIVRGLVIAHGGTIRLRSNKERGTVFRLRLPAVWCDPSATAQQAQSASAQPSHLVNGRARRILFVEDHVDTARITRRLLTRRGYDVIWASTIAEAHEAAQANIFDLVVSDIGLTDGNGCDLMAELAATQGLRGVAVSGYATPADITRSHAAGFRAHLVKPIAFEELCEQIDRLCDDPCAIQAA